MIASTTESPHDASDRIDPALVRIAWVAGFGSLLLNLSSTTLNVALEKLLADLHTTFLVAQWTITGYLLALTIVLPTFRWMTERVGIKRLYVASMLGFTLTSALCGVAWSIESLVVFRILQGAVGGLLTPIAQALTAQYAGERHMGRLLSTVAVPVLAATLLGPFVGGVLVEKLSWRSIFFLNVPLGIACALVCARVLPNDDANRRGASSLDVRGLALLSPGMAFAIYAITNLRRGGASLSTTTLPFAIAFALLAVFVIHARREPTRALLDLRLFRSRTVGAALVTYVLTSLASFGGQLLLPLYFQRVLGQSPMGAGLYLVPQGLGMLMTMPRIGRLTDKHDPGKLAIGGVVLTLLGTAAFAFEASPTWLLVASLFLRGAGLGATNNPALATVYRNLPKSEVANATTALNIVQRIGAPLGTAIMAVLLQWRLTASATKVQAFAQTFAASLALNAVTIVSASFLVGAAARARVDAPVEITPGEDLA